MSLPDEPALRRALEDYSTVVERQGVERLAELDRWYREDLPALIAGRSPMHLTHSDLVRLTEWKMARGAWRARNLVLVRSNDPAEVEEASTVALSLIPHPTRPISQLAKLRGVGPATASAAVAAAAPDTYPFFDEVVAEQLTSLGRVAWTLACYARYAEELRAAAGELGGAWTPALLERALWAHAGGKAAARAGG
jgi:hypothetical protein